MFQLRLLGGQLAIGAAAIFARLALRGGGPMAVGALRLAISAIAIALISLALHRARGIARGEERTLAVAGVALAAHFALWITSLLYTSVAISTLLVTTTPLWTMAYDVAIARRRVPPRLWIAFVPAMVGVALVIAVPSHAAPIAGLEPLGDALALGGAVAIGIYLTIVRHVRERRPEASTVAIVLRTYSWAALLLVVTALVAREPAPPLSDGTAWFGILGMALVSQVLGHTALNSALRRLSPSIVAVSTLLEPVFAAVLAALIFGEHLSSLQAVGGAAVLAAVGVVLWENPSAETA